MEIEISFVNKLDQLDPWERVNYVGGRNLEGALWVMSQKAVVGQIESGQNSFFISVNGKYAKVIVVRSPWGNNYIKTEADSFLVDNLLNLPPIPLM